jgi:hypothetical protein
VHENPPGHAALAAVRDLASIADEEPERARLNARVIPDVPALAGRDLVRQRHIADAVSGALTEFGVAPSTPGWPPRPRSACGVWRVAVVEGAGAADARALPDVVAAAADAMRSL